MQHSVCPRKCIGGVCKEFYPMMDAHKGNLTRLIHKINSDACATELTRVLQRGSQLTVEMDHGQWDGGDLECCCLHDNKVIDIDGRDSNSARARLIHIYNRFDQERCEAID